ncbi:hypothetical protein SAMN04488109_3230 [Chryseolinea serpens]|uniref:Uncharacterized protein n=1 Tax=Chryseolinea serpens TaxID=947013 RepID=A0A1M5R7I8_9BACT|nr:hypothetical protein SAMN04488109_3230 [Chryseolinea serpens]
MSDARWNAIDRRLRSAAILVSLLSIPWPSSGQVGKIYIKGTAREVITGEIDHFEFNPSDTTLTAASFEYLNKFGSFYNDSLSRNYSYLIVLDLESTEEDKWANANLSCPRLLAVFNYLQKNFKVDGSKFRGRYRETITHICYAHIAPTKRPAKKRKK